MTLLEIYEKVAAHLKSLPRQSAEFGSCRYRHTTETGSILSCAVGCLIKDEHYKRSLEGRRPWNDGVREALMLSGIPSRDDVWDLLDSLQDLHDDDRNWGTEENRDQPMNEMGLKELESLRP